MPAYPQEEIHDGRVTAQPYTFIRVKITGRVRGFNRFHVVTSVDRFCIDKKDAVELSAAINSMFRWYKEAARCYVYLSDVSIREEGAA